MKKALCYLFLVCVFFLCACSEKNAKKELKVPVQVKKPVESKQTNKEVKKALIKKKEELQLKAAPALPKKKVVLKKTFYQTPKEEIVYKRVYYPFFENMAELPYSLKMKIERLAYRVSYLKKKKRAISITVKGYASKDEKGNLLRLAFLRAKNTALYLSWKSNVSMQFFKLRKSITSKGNRKYRRRVLIVIKIK